MQLNNLLRFDYWLDPTVTSQPAGRAMWLVVAAGLIGCWVVGLLWRMRRLPRDVAVAWVIASALVGLVGLGRLFVVPVLGWRVGWLLAGIVALGPIARRLASHLREDGFMRDCLDAMAFAQPRKAALDWHPSTAVAWLLYNLFGLTILFANIATPLWAAPWLLLVLVAPLLIAFALRLRRGQPPRLWQLSALAPLTITYLTALMGLLGIRLPGPLSGVLFLPLSLIVTAAYAFAISGRWSMVSGQQASDQRFVRAGAALLILVSTVWAAWAALTLRTHGVTGSDSYAYAQMGVDLATRGTVFHPFALVGVTYDLNIPSYPISHVGYRIPTDTSRESTTVWPPGYAVFTGLAYLVGGETGLYLITPLLNLIALGVVGWFAWVVIGRDFSLTPGPSPAGRGVVVAALTVMLTATSYQQVEWQMIPMADIAAQVFSLLAVGLALTARGSKVKAVLSGLCIGIAFGIRYTQVLIAPAVALALLLPSPSEGEGPGVRLRVKNVPAAALAAAIAALPVLIYHHNAFGSWLATGSEELGNFSLALLPQTLWRTLGELNHYREFGLLTPLIVIGLVAMWRHHRRALAVLAVYFVIPFGFHIAYAYLRLRDILFLFPVISMLAALGAAELWRWITSRVTTPRGWPALHESPVWQLAATTALCALSFVFVLRAMETLSLPVTRGFSAFGYLVREQRASFDKVAALTPDNAVVATTLNSGAVDLHAGRQTFRPATWSPQELIEFVNHLQREKKPVFILEDGDELKESLATLRANYRLVEVGRVDVPYYQATGGGSENRSVPLYRVLSLER